MKIDTTKIEGYSEMTVEQKLATLEGYEMPEPDLSGMVKKDVFDQKASEAAELSRKLKERMSAEEVAAEERKAAEAQIQAELEALRRENAISRYRANYIALGYDENLADETAIAFVDGKTEKVFENQKKHIEAIRKAEKASALAEDGNNPPPGAGSTSLNYEKRIEEANSMGDMTQVAALIREQQLQNKK